MLALIDTIYNEDEQENIKSRIEKFIEAIANTKK
jgi:hypothetical protein